MNHLPLGAMLCVWLAAACASPSGAGEAGAGEGQTLSSVPTDVGQRSRVDFGGAAELLGWDVEPKASAAPGSTVRVRLYFRSTKRLTPGWRLVTELVTPHDGKTVAEARGDGPTPSDWGPGSIFRIEQTVTVPDDVTASALALLVGLSREPVQVEGAEVEGLSSLRLPVLSGLTDGKQRAVVAELRTGVRPGEKSPPKTQRRKADDRRPAGERGPRTALSALRRALPSKPPSEAPKEKP